MSNNSDSGINFVNEDDVIANERERLIQRCDQLEAQVASLKEVSSLRKRLLELREQEIKDLIGKLKLFETAIENETQSRDNLSQRVDLAEKACIELTTKLQGNIDQLSATKATYEERIKSLLRDLEKSDQDCQKRSDELNDSELRNIELNSKVEDYGKLIVDNQEVLKKMQEEMKVVAERNRVFSYQMNLLNTLFNETEGTPIDFERIKAIGDIVRESQNMPCLMDPNVPDNAPLSRRTSIDFDTLMDQVDTDKYTGDVPGEESCYKKVTTVEGPQLVLSVSQTFIKLKDLILEKKHLHREIESLKQLNFKLESKVDRQEKRLYVVTVELNKTWNLVAKLKMQHSKLHNSEAVLKYELHEKRKLLERLKTELSKSRQTWAKVRQKHDESANLCQQMRAEFARRRQPESEESGAFSDSSSPSCSSPNREINNETDTEEVDSETQVPEEEEEEDDVDLSSIERGFEIEEVDPLDDFVSDLVQEIEAVTTSAAEVENESRDPAMQDEVYLTTRANRLRQLEDASRVLYSRLMATTVQSSALASRLAQLHDHYGSHDSAVPDSQAFAFDGIPIEVTNPEPVPLLATSANASSFESHEAVPELLTFPGNMIVVETPPDAMPLPEMTPLNIEVPSPDSENISVMDLTQNAEALMEMESPALLAELAVSRIELESRSPFVLQSTTTQVFDMGVNNNNPSTSNNANSTASHTLAGPEVNGEDENQEFGDNDDDMSPASSPDANSLSRLIIQQVPKRLEILKQQNWKMKERERSLLEQVEEQKSKLVTMEQENEHIAEQLGDEIESKDAAINKLRSEIADLTSLLASDREKLSNFMNSYLQEKSDLESTQKPSSTKNCKKCDKKFTLFRRKKHQCNVCKNSFCRDCKLTTGSDGKPGRKIKICPTCSDRRMLLESTAQTFL